MTTITVRLDMPRELKESIDDVRESLDRIATALEKQAGLTEVVREPQAEVAEDPNEPAEPTEYDIKPMPRIGYVIQGISRNFLQSREPSRWVDDKNEAFVFVSYEEAQEVAEAGPGRTVVNA